MTQHLNEKWIATVKNAYNKNKPVNVYLNPSRKEYLDAIAELDDETSRTYQFLRAIVTKGGMGDIYIFDSEMLHQLAWNQLGRVSGKGALVPLTLERGRTFSISGMSMQGMNGANAPDMPKDMGKFYKYLSTFIVKNLKANKKLQSLTAWGFKEA